MSYASRLATVGFYSEPCQKTWTTWGGAQLPGKKQKFLEDCGDAGDRASSGPTRSGLLWAHAQADVFFGLPSGKSWAKCGEKHVGPQKENGRALKCCVQTNFPQPIDILYSLIFITRKPRSPYYSGADLLGGGGGKNGDSPTECENSY